MKFGKSEDEALAEPPRGGGGGDFMKYCREGDNRLRIIDEYPTWNWYWEHFNPGGFAFPCTNDRDTCPGCTSDVEKMQKASRKIAFNAFDGEYTNVWKVPKTVADKLKARYERIGTLKDRDYIIRQIVTKTGKNTTYDYDVEGLEKEEFDYAEVEQYVKDPEVMLAQAYEDAWGDDAKVRESRTRAKDSEQTTQVRAKIERAQKAESPAEKVEEKVYTEDQLRKMDVWDLAALCKAEGMGNVPPLGTSDEIVDWMLDQQTESV